MHLSAETFDDLLRNAIGTILEDGTPTNPSRGGARELFGVLLQLDQPRARLSRTENRGVLFSALGELLWYLSRTNSLEFIKHYIRRYIDESEDGVTIHGGYGPRLFGMREVNQVECVIDLLKRKPDTRRAVIQLINAEDVAAPYKEIPCTCMLQFALRDGRLSMLVTMRSNDVYWGLPHDVFTFTMLQEIIARSIGAEVGVYKHAVGSLHLYDDHVAGARAYIDEGWQQTDAPMPSMPPGDPWDAIKTILAMESNIRAGQDVSATMAPLDPYWQDIARLLQVQQAYVARSQSDILRIRDSLSDASYAPFIEKKHAELQTILNRKSAP